MALNKEQLERYSRHIVLDDVGSEGQQKIIKGKVLIIGTGGLGSSATLHLAAAGVGTIGLVDDDVVTLSNLQRQVIHFTPDIGKPKVLSAKEKITHINPDVDVITYQEKVSAGNIIDIIKDQDYDFIIDATDNFPAKFLINDASVFTQKPFSHGGVLRFDGQTMTYIPGNACYRCIFGYAPPADVMPKPAEAGVFGVVPGILGTIQAAEALKYLMGREVSPTHHPEQALSDSEECVEGSGLVRPFDSPFGLTPGEQSGRKSPRLLKYLVKSGELLVNRLLIFNALNMEFRSVKVKKNLQCPACGNNPKIKELEDTMRNV